MVVHICNPSDQKAEARRLGVQGQPWQKLERSYLQKKKKRTGPWIQSPFTPAHSPHLAKKSCKTNWAWEYWGS
jgi:hypothetical protein